MHDFAFHFESIKLKTPHTLILEGVCSQSNGKVIINYSGTEVINDSTVVVPEDILELLGEQLELQYGYGPFDKIVLKKLFKEKQSFYIDYKQDNS